MPKQSARKRKETPRKGLILTPLVIISIVLVLIISSSFLYAGHMEENDLFCGSCHTQPESTYLGRALAGSAVDLASIHHSKSVKCIDCHAGAGITGRIGGIIQGAGNLFAYITHTGTQPAVLKTPFADSDCIKCHEETIYNQQNSQHYHLFLPRWQAADPNAARCVSCHTTHTTDGDASIQFLEVNRTQDVCQQCHDNFRN
jgi:predicted CXXCH cytochrome family protein